MSEKTTLENVKVSDAVCVRQRYGIRGDLVKTTFGTVEKVTKTQIVAFDGKRFSRRTGTQIGHRQEWTIPLKIEPVTEQIKEEAYELADAMLKAREG